MSEAIEYPPGFGLKDVVAWGLIVVDRPSKTFIKTPIFEDCSDLILREREIYERFTQRGGHKGTLRYYGAFGSGIGLEYAPNRDLRSYNSKHKHDIEFGLQLRWTTQIAEALGFVHRAGVIRGDLTC